jgi:hypothetical protein
MSLLHFRLAPWGTREPSQPTDTLFWAKKPSQPPLAPAFPMYLRFAARGPLHEAARRPRGLFQVGYQVLREAPLGAEELARLQQTLFWFERRLAKPARFARSRKPGAQSKALSWFKPTAREHIAQARELAELLREVDVDIVMSTTRTPGYIVYEDAHQIAAEPFRRA